MDPQEYWIGRGVDYDAVWDAFEGGQQYVAKFAQMKVHLLRITFDLPNVADPLFNAEAVGKTMKGYFHDLKRMCLPVEDYNSSGPLFLYEISRGSSVWSFLGELRQLLMLGTTLSDEKVVGQKLDNLDKKLDILRKHFGASLPKSDYEAFMKAQTPAAIDRAVKRLFKQGLKTIELSKEPFEGAPAKIEASLVELKALLGEGRGPTR